MIDCQYIYYGESKNAFPFLAVKFIGNQGEEGEEFYIGGDRDPQLFYTENHDQNADGPLISFHQRGNNSAIVVYSTEPMEITPEKNFQFDLAGTVTASSGGFGTELVRMGRGWFQTSGLILDENTVYSSYQDISLVRQDSYSSLGVTPDGIPGARLYALPNEPFPNEDVNRIVPSVDYQHGIRLITPQGYISPSTGFIAFSAGSISGVFDRFDADAANVFYSHPFVYLTNSFVSNSSSTEEDINVRKYEVTISGNTASIALLETRTFQCQGFGDSSMFVFAALPPAF